MMIILLIAMLFTISNCGTADRIGAGLTGYSTSCIDGVEYLQFTSGTSVAYDISGKVKLCD